MISARRLAAATSLVGLSLATSVGAQNDFEHEVSNSVERGLKFLAAAQQPDGGWLGRTHSDPAVTALVVKCFIQDKDYGPQHAIARRAITYIRTFVQSDGGIYIPDHGLRNYYTSVCLMALAATKDEAHAEAVGRAQVFLKRGQWDEEEGHDRSSPWYGGAGYGKHKRPDLSNTQMMLEALAQSGLPPDDPVYKKAMVFISRSQMLSDTNDQPLARGASDGGFIYTPANNGESKAGVNMIDGKPQLRSYGSMTYAGFKSMLYAGLDRDDPRVKAAVAWIKRHYTLEENPNMPGRQSLEGLYYYYHVFARALEAWDRAIIVDDHGQAHQWRKELCAKLLSLQCPDGSWVNQADRWYEGNPYLVTAYSLLAIQTATR